MATPSPSPTIDRSAAVLERHAVRRAGGVPTVSVLNGPPGAAGAAWRRWAASTGRRVVAARAGGGFPFPEWIRSLAEQVDLPAAAVQCVARHVGRAPDDFLATWRTLTAADRERRWSTLPTHPDDDVLHALAALVDRRSSTEDVAAALVARGERAAPAVVRLVPPGVAPAVLMGASSGPELEAVAEGAARFALAAPSAPIAVAASDAAWREYLAAAADSRTKAILKEGEFAVAVLDRAAVAEALAAAGASPRDAAAVAAVVPEGADPLLVEAAVAAAAALSPDAPPDRARSAMERFLFGFLESIPETAGRFELNGLLDFRFGNRAAEVDLLCRTPPIAVELDGYHHFRDAADYRRDRSKDWELQRRGFLVLRFLAEDVFSNLETVRDRILSAVAEETPGACS